MTGLTKRLGDGESKGGSKVFLAFVAMWMRVSLRDAGKARFGMMGNPKFSLCYVRFGTVKSHLHTAIILAFCA